LSERKDVTIENLQTALNAEGLTVNQRFVLIGIAASTGQHGEMKYSAARNWAETRGMDGPDAYQAIEDLVADGYLLDLRQEGLVRFAK
jgi:hypothetical protein